MKYRQWVVDVIPCRRPHVCGWKSENQWPVVSCQWPVKTLFFGLFN